MRKIKEIMSSSCITVSKDNTLYEAAGLMDQHNIGFLPVVDQNKLIGVITDRDLVIRGYAAKKDGTIAVTEVLTKDYITIEPDATVDEAAEIMAAEQIRRLPVVSNGDLLGVISLGDMAIREIFVNEAGEALSNISEHNHSASSQIQH
ncbi:CBS domain-containing protein [Paenibacillus sepulcri]|uniref:CBS domain-containing protein n=1 Tax=Paenibacillus sepulcri TaxID=359917 RepID=A0ABS7C1H3_9BACL|nr:CBS domain-containing protein [Paenibacillus sepulcri]